MSFTPGMARSTNTKHTPWWKSFDKTSLKKPKDNRK